MKKLVSDVKKFESPYAPSFHIYCCRVDYKFDGGQVKQVHATGKAFKEEDALAAMYGEVAERCSLILRESDKQCNLMDVAGNYIGHIKAQEVLYSGDESDLGGSGCATHNLMDVAIYSAVCELIERRSVMIWWNQIALVERISIDRNEFAELERLTQRARLHAKEYRETRFFRIIQPGEIQTVIAQSAATDGTQIAAAYAADTNILTALKKALCELLSVEMETSDLMYARLTNTAFHRNSYRGLVAARQKAFLTSHKSLFETKQDYHGDVNTNEVPTSAILSDLDDRGETVALVDLTRPEIGLPTCRAFYQDRSLQPQFPKNFDLSPL